MPSRNSKNGKRLVSRPKPKPLHLLILECDAEKLASQGLAFAPEVQAVISLLPKEIRTRAAAVNSQQDFVDALIHAAENYSCVHNILIIGHSNANMLQVAPGFPLEWRTLGKWLHELRPQRMALVACQAGQFMPTRALFDGLPSVRKIYASPFKSTKQQFQALHLLFGYLFMSRNYDPNLIVGGQIANFFRTGGVILECTRKDPEGNQLLQFLGAVMP